MKLFEVTNGAVGCSYVRVYVWANDRAEGMALAERAFGQGALSISLLFDPAADARPFVTKPDDEGWTGPLMFGESDQHSEGGKDGD